MSESIEAAQQDIVDDFSLLGDWMERYQHIIDLGRQLPPLDAEEMVEENRLHGCQSQVWLLTVGDSECLRFRANSDAQIVAGLIALLLRVYSDRPAAEIVEAKPWFVDEIGLHEHLSPTRSNGLHAMLEAIRQRARQAQKAA